MSNEFDPYLNWLGISPDERPPTHYRLLDIAPSINNPNVIEKAAAMRIADIESMAGDDQQQLAESIVEDITAAEQCLLDPQSRAAYDAELREQPKAAPARTAALPKAKIVGKSAKQSVAASAAAEPSFPSFETDAPGTSPSARYEKQSQKSPALMIGICGGIAVALIAVIVIFATRPSDSGTKKKTAKKPDSQDTQDQTDVQPKPVDSAEEPSAPADRQKDGEGPGKSTDDPPTVAKSDIPPTADPTPPIPDPIPPSVEDPPTKPAAPSDSRLAIPDAAQLKQAQPLIREVLKDENDNAKTADEKRRFARKLITVATDTDDEPAIQYLLLRTGRDLAAKVGDAELAVRAVSRTAERFQIEAATMKVEALARASKNITDAKLFAAFDQQVRRLIDEAVRNDEFELSTKMADALYEAARATGDISVVKDISTYHRLVKHRERHFEFMKQWVAKLQADPSDAEANHYVGAFHCYVKGNWKVGLPLLAKGNDPDAQAAADKDLSLPTDSHEQAELGNLWWDVAGSAATFERFQLAKRAAYWYQKAILELPDGDVRQQVTGQMAEVAEQFPNLRGERFVGAPRIVIGSANGLLIEDVRDCSAKMHRLTIGQGFNAEKAWTLRLEILPITFAPPSQIVFFWGDGRAGLDPLHLGIHTNNIHFKWQDTRSREHGQLLHAFDGEQAGRWIQIQIDFDPDAHEVAMFIDGKLVDRVESLVVPAADRPMPYWLGGLGDPNAARFHGQVRNVWYGNVGD